MSQAFNSLPAYGTELVKNDRTGKFTDKSWYLFWSNLFQGLAPGAEMSITIGSSPFSYAAKARGFMIVNGGTVSSITFTRGTNTYVTGQTQGCIPMNAYDQISITYSVAPTLTFVPT